MVDGGSWRPAARRWRSVSRRGATNSSGERRSPESGRRDRRLRRMERGTERGGGYRCPATNSFRELGLDDYKYGFVTDSEPVFRTRPGLDEDVVRQISARKDEPEWMLKSRLKALRIYEAKPMPQWGGDLSELRRRSTRPTSTSEAAGADGALLGRRAGQHQADVREARNPRGGASNSRRGRGPVRVRDGVPFAQGRMGVEGRHLRFDRGRAEESSRAVPRVLRNGDPGGRQQVRRAELGGLVGRVVRLHPPGRSPGNAAPGLLPGQPGASGPVRAHADHRRRGIPRPLHRRAAPPRSTRPIRSTPA